MFAGFMETGLGRYSLNSVAARLFSRASSTLSGSRMLAKIAHCLAVVSHDGELDYWLPDVILGRSPAIGHYVGNEGIDLKRTDPPALHMTKTLRRGEHCLVAMRLFASHDLSPTYVAVAGRFKT